VRTTNAHQNETGPAAMLHNVILMIFAFAGGLTLSGLVVSCYRVVATASTEENPFLYYPVIAFAGASILMENVVRSRKSEEVGVSFVAAMCSFFWSSMLGLLLLSVCHIS
jgi:hypothetical protein